MRNLFFFLFFAFLVTSMLLFVSADVSLNNGLLCYESKLQRVHCGVNVSIEDTSFNYSSREYFTSYNLYNTESNNKSIDYELWVCRCKEKSGNPINKCHFFYPFGGCKKIAISNITIPSKESRVLDLNVSQFGNQLCGSFQTDIFIKRVNGRDATYCTWGGLVSGATVLRTCRDCADSYCGDGFIGPSEECDFNDRNKSISCSQDCKILQCSSNCSAEGIKRCTSTGFESCSDFNGDGCLEWGQETFCNDREICSNGQCIIDEEPNSIESAYWAKRDSDNLINFIEVDKSSIGNKVYSIVNTLGFLDGTSLSITVYIDNLLSNDIEIGSFQSNIYSNRSVGEWVIPEDIFDDISFDNSETLKLYFRAEALDKSRASRALEVSTSLVEDLLDLEIIGCEQFLDEDSCNGASFTFSESQFSGFNCGNIQEVDSCLIETQCSCEWSGSACQIVTSESSSCSNGEDTCNHRLVSASNCNEESLAIVNYNDLCDNSIDSYSFSCRRNNVLLPFFSFSNLIVSVLLIALIYFFYISFYSKKRKK